ncbi:MAG: LysM peptidoglycan-binding domain-containing protein [Chloroflexota bacterium]|nr:LysM peptidoglycan-binding domain-containing protein [Chloroflexota bacterium]MDE2945989.1 LysM peptidoglycan-binding domain-containing protein [Chloroflexota bacterium]
MKILRPVLLLAFLLIPRALAQSNPTVTACGLPAQGTIVSSVTYTMNDDCALTGTLQANLASATVTINGGGHTITGGAFILFQGSNMALNLNSVTIDGGRQTRTETILVHALNANNVTFINSRSGPAVNVHSVANLTNVLLTRNLSSNYALGGNGSAVHAAAGTTHVWTNVVLRNNFGNGGAMGLRSGATLTTNGCLTLSGNVPFDVYAPAGTTWTDNSTGPCSGTIGNGDAAVISPPSLMACGLPGPGILDASATYTLRSDCQLDGVIRISEDVDIRIIGNGNTIRSSRALYHFQTAVTSSLRLENVELNGVRFFHWGDLRGQQLRLRNTVDGMILNLGEARFSNSLFEDNNASSSNGRSVLLAWGAYSNGFTSFTDSSFRNNQGGLGPLQNAGGTIELNGCVLFEDNSPADYSGAVVDNRDPDCDAEIVNPVVRILPPQSARRADRNCNPHCELPPIPKQEECDLKLGAIGVICRPRVQPPVAAVWRIRPHPDGAHLPAQGSFMLAVNQPQVEAVEEGLVACTADGRVAVRTGLAPEIRHFFEISPKYEEELKIPRRYIVFSKGPNVEGKVNHIVLDHLLDGRVFGIVSTFGGPPANECLPSETRPRPEPAPAPVYAPPVQPQAPQPDGSIIHVVRPGDTVSAIAVAYRIHQLDIIMVNQLEHMGRWIYPGQELHIREASGN